MGSILAVSAEDHAQDPMWRRVIPHPEHLERGECPILAPEGRQTVARGVSPWEARRARRFPDSSPEGATEVVGRAEVLSPLRGSQSIVMSQRLPGAYALVVLHKSQGIIPQHVISNYDAFSAAERRHSISLGRKPQEAKIDLTNYIN